jgi:hypothetical protein
MGQIITKEDKLDQADFQNISIKIKDVLNQLNYSFRNISLLPVNFNGDIINTNSIIQIYIDCVYLDNNYIIDDEIIDICTTIFTLMLKDSENNFKINPLLENIISNCLQACSQICSSIPGCKNISYNLLSISSYKIRLHPMGFKILIYPIID